MKEIGTSEPTQTDHLRSLQLTFVATTTSYLNPWKAPCPARGVVPGKARPATCRPPLLSQAADWIAAAGHNGAQACQGYVEARQIRRYLPLLGSDSRTATFSGLRRAPCWILKEGETAKGSPHLQATGALARHAQHVGWVAGLGSEATPDGGYRRLPRREPQKRHADLVACLKFVEGLQLVLGHLVARQNPSMIAILQTSRQCGDTQFRAEMAAARR